MEKKILWISIAINLVFIVVLLSLSYRYREELCQKWIVRNHSAEIVMFGDSHTEIGKWNFLLNTHPVLRLGWGGYTSDRLAQLIPLSIGYNPKYVFILCGGNDIYDKCFSVENTVGNFKIMADTLRSNHIIPVFQKLMYQHKNPSFNASIDAINGRLEEYCLKENIVLLNIGKDMYDATGLKENFTIDNLHLNENGYKVWSETVNTFLKNKKINNE